MSESQAGVTVASSKIAAHMRAPVLPGDVRLPWDQALLDAALEYEIGSDRARFALRPGTARLGVDVLTVIRFADGDRVRAFEFRGDPGVVQLDPRWHQATRHFVRLGFLHILDGVDHLLFLACLVIPLRRLRPLVVVVSAFTLAHSVTLVASALDYAPAIGGYGYPSFGNVAYTRDFAGAFQIKTGVLVTPDVLLYTKVGMSAANETWRYGATPFYSPFSRSEIAVRPEARAGVEWAVTDKVTLGLEVGFVGQAIR